MITLINTRRRKYNWVEHGETVSVPNNKVEFYLTRGFEVYEAPEDTTEKTVEQEIQAIKDLMEKKPSAENKKVIIVDKEMTVDLGVKNIVEHDETYLVMDGASLAVIFTWKSIVTIWGTAQRKKGKEEWQTHVRWATSLVRVFTSWEAQAWVELATLSVEIKK